MNTVMPWLRLEAAIEPHYVKSGKVSRPSIGAPRKPTRTWKTRCATARPCTSSPASTYAVRTCHAATKLLKFRRLLGQHDLTAAILAEGSTRT